VPEQVDLDTREAALRDAFWPETGCAAATPFW
jgi:hypothetical protein